MRVVRSILILVLGLAAAAAAREPHRSQLGLTVLATASGEPAAIEDFYLIEDCGSCHPRQLGEMAGSMHSVAHEDRLYRHFAELARAEAGDEVYRYCSGCHSPAGVAADLIPGKRDPELPAEAKAGVTCDVCHQVTRLNGAEGPWQEPGNASLVLDPGRVKFGPLDAIRRNPGHKGAARDFLSSSEFCASCHTVIHPLNGLRIEHTYAEWKKSVYAENGIQCQDCHMRSVEDARKVAETLKPIEVRGRYDDGRGPDDRVIHPHYFVGGNADAGRLGGDAAHAEMAVARLKSAAALEIRAPAVAAPGGELSFDIAVRNVGAGHELPTSLTELRQMWVALEVRGEDGTVHHASGKLDDHGEIPPGAMRLGAELEDASGKLTYKPWEAVAFRWRRTVAAKGEERDTIRVPLGAEVTGKLLIEARLLYRIAPPHVVKEVMKEEAFEPTVVEMASARAAVDLAAN